MKYKDQNTVVKKQGPIAECTNTGINQNFGYTEREKFKMQNIKAFRVQYHIRKGELHESTYYGRRGRNKT